MPSKTIVFIHGMFMTGLCWEHWVKYFESAGYTCLAPNWPGRDKPIEEIRRAHPDPELGRLNLTAIVEHFTAIIKSLDSKPILIGHSMGGLVTQILLNRDLAAAAVAIDSAPPAGVFTTTFSFLKANWPMISPFVSKYEPRRMSFEDFCYAFVNTLPLDEARAAYERYTVPESRCVPQESLGGIAKIDFRKPHAPLLLTAGSDDNIIPPDLNRSNYAKYRASSSPTDFKEFTGRTHFVIGQKGWEEVAGYVKGWLKEKDM
jgi:pimeloyl-ACP methyl ester carboxylesterase